MTAGPLLLALAVVLAQHGAAPATPDELDRIRQLYTNASYDEALTRLSALDEAHDPNEVDQYRALCLIGLGRVTEADQTLERIVHRAPAFRIDQRHASPAFVARFAAVRTRVLPIAAQRMYTRAKTTFDLKDYGSAAAQLEDLLAVLRAEASSGDASLARLQRLAEGFLRLTQAELKVSTRAIYSLLDRDVTPPVDVERVLPPWNPPTEISWRWYRGLVQLVIDERGAVEDVALVESVADFYDDSLVEAARQWRFKPAERAGRPVKYRKLVEVTMRPE